MSDAPWRIAVVRRAEKEIARLDPPVRQRVVEALGALADDPRSGSLRKLKGRPEHRLRVGDGRVIIQLDVDRRTIFVKHVLPRGKAYDR